MPGITGERGDTVDKYWYLWSPVYVQFQIKLLPKPQRVHPIDALLADLQSTTQQNHYQQQQQQYPQSQQNHHYSYGSSSPSPRGSNRQSYDSDKSLEGRYAYDANQAIYEPQNIRQTSSSVTVTKTTSASVPPPLSRNNNPSQVPSKPAMSLGNNLSELDSLLQELNTPQFMAEVDRNSGVGTSCWSPLDDIMFAQTGYSTVNVQPTPPGKPAPPVAPKPNIARNDTVDAQQSVSSLLDDLQNSVPSTDSNRYQQTRRYERIETTTTTTDRYNPPAQTASIATRELDELMNSLSDFKMNPPNTSPVLAQSPEHVVEPPYAKLNKPPKQQQQASLTIQNQTETQMQAAAPPAQVPQVESQQAVTRTQTQQSALDTMLGNLQSDMNKQGVSTVAKGHCAACNKPIVGQVITALGRIWHPEHFTCKHCQEQLGTKNFFEREGFPYCERDYHSLFAPRCAFCSGPILDKCVTALDKTWHPEHFFCALCERPFDDGGFHEKDGKAYCRDDYFEMFAPKCGGCDRPIMENYISALNKQWHPECFICQDCHMPFSGGSFFDHNGLPYCETHYHAKRGSLCAGCQKPITGRCITAMYKKFHPEHFVCAFCLKQLNKGTFKEQNDKPYCHACFVKLFG